MCLFRCSWWVFHLFVLLWFFSSWFQTERKEQVGWGYPAVQKVQLGGPPEDHQETPLRCFCGNAGMCACVVWKGDMKGGRRPLTSTAHFLTSSLPDSLAVSSFRHKESFQGLAQDFLQSEAYIPYLSVIAQSVWQSNSVLDGTTGPISDRKCFLWLVIQWFLSSCNLYWCSSGCHMSGTQCSGTMSSCGLWIVFMSLEPENRKCGTI